MEQTQETATNEPITPKPPSKLKGRTLPVKFKGPDGETWAGRGRKPAWVVGDKEQYRVK
jgi:DNA-binding protein H-NS